MRSFGWIGNYGLKQKALVIFLFCHFAYAWGRRPGSRQAERSRGANLSNQASAVWRL